MTFDENGDPAEILLLGPGPSPVAREVLLAGAESLVGHLDPLFLATMDQVQGQLRQLFQTDNRFTMPLSGTGSSGMEAAVANLVEDDDRVVVAVHGIFGGRIAEMVRRHRGEAVVVESPFGHAIDVDGVRAAVKAAPTKMLAVVHAETSTGVLQPLESLAEIARDADCLFLVDAVTSFCGTPLDIDGLGVDVCYSGTQKCVSAPPGLSPITVSDRALERVEARQRPPATWYLDFGLLAGYWDADGGRAYHHTAPVSAVQSLATALQLLVDEGAEARFARHAQVAHALWRGLESLGLELLVDESLRTPMLTSVCIPDGVDDLSVRRRLRDHHHIEVGGGLGPLGGRVWRIGLMGHGARPENVVRVVTALGEALADQGYRRDVSGALDDVAADLPRS